MREFFQDVVMRLALCGLAASLVVLALRTRFVRDAFDRLLSTWRSLTAFGRAAVCSFLLVGVLVGGDKTNQVNNLPPQQGGVFLTGFTGFTGLSGLLPPTPSSLNPVSPVNPVQTTLPQQTFAEWKAANWNIRGAWKDSFWLAFDEGWVFPWGTNHLSGVEVVSYGQVWPTPFDTNAVASIGVPIEIVRGTTTFGYEFTPSNSYRLVWNDAAVNRDTYNLVSAALELFRNGDVIVTTNGVEELRPRVLPFPHDGFGQDEEWVAANFTNAAEIAAAGGYAAWVDAQVGEGLTNGLYKLSVTVADDPPETTFISVGDLSVAVTNAGDYVFLLEKGPAYSLSFFPPSTNIVVSAVDDVPLVRSAPLLRSAYAWGDSEDGVWQPDIGEFACYYAAGGESATCWWLPALCGFPDVTHLGPSDPSAEFTGLLFDCAHPENASFEWTASEGLVVATPQSQTTLVTATDIPSWRRVWMSVSASFGPHASLSSTLNSTVGTNSTPQVRVSLSVPDTLFPNDDVDTYTDPAPFDMDCGTQRLSDDDIARCAVTLEGDEYLSGTLRLHAPGPGGAYAYCGEILPDLNTNMCYSESIDTSRDWDVDDVHGFTKLWAIEAGSSALSYNGMSVCADWIPEEGATVSVTSRFSIVRAVAEPICSATTNVVENGVEHTLVLNPCGVEVGKDAYFRVEVNPSEYPDSKITWTQGSDDAGVVDFMGPCACTGRTVRVRGVTPGKVSLEVSVGNCPSDKPTFPLYVVTNKVRHISVWIAANNKGQNQVCDESKVRDMLPTVNDVFSQIGLTFVIDRVDVLSNNMALSLYYYEESTNGIPVLDRKHMTFNELVGSVSANDIKCIFVNDFADSDDTRAATLRGAGIVMTSDADALALAHELGHELGAEDIYVSKGNLDVLGELFWWANASDDWSNGCFKGGSGYYRRNIKCEEIIRRLLMHGHSSGNSSRGRDMSIGPVYGVRNLNNEEIEKDISFVGFKAILEGGTEQ